MTYYNDCYTLMARVSGLKIVQKDIHYFCLLKVSKKLKCSTDGYNQKHFFRKTDNLSFSKKCLTQEINQ